ncbi:MAG: glycosyltransferase family 4 protein [Methanothrix sp.]
MKTYKVILLSRYSRLGASSRVRCYQYLPYLDAHGFCTTVAPLLDDEYLKTLYACGQINWRQIFSSYYRRLRHLLTSRSYDLIWIEKELFPFTPAWAEVMLSYMGIPYVVEYDDAVFHRYDMHSNKFVRVLLKSKIDVVMRRSAMVIAGNEYLAERARRAGAKRVEYMPSVIDLERYPSTSPCGNRIFTIGWIGTPVTAQYLRLVRSALTEVCQDGKARLVLVGSGQIELDGVPTEIRPWSEETEIVDLQSFDVGIMPLPDEPWERGKCGFKLIQYMACGKPVVASPVGVNERIVEDGFNGFLATTKEEWLNALSDLRDDHDLRDRMGRAGRKKVEVNYCVQVTAQRLEELFRSVCR